MNGYYGDQNYMYLLMETFHVATILKHADVTSIDLYRFCDTSEDAYAGVVYFRAQDKCRNVHVFLVISKTEDQGCSSD